MWLLVLMTAFTLCSLNVKEVLENDPDAYYSKNELLENLLVMYNSLIETKDNSIANGKLLDVIRQVSPPFSQHIVGMPMSWGSPCSLEQRFMNFRQASFHACESACW